MTNAHYQCNHCAGFGFLLRGQFPWTPVQCTACHGIGQRYIDGPAPEPKADAWPATDGLDMVEF